MDQKNDWDYMMKLLVIGDSGVGKTCILMRFTEGLFQTTHLTTIGIDFKIKTIQVDGKTVKLQIWDTAGQERFRTIVQTYYKGAMGIVLAYSITDLQSFQSIEHWMKQIQTHAGQDVVKILVGNKADLEENRQVKKEDGQRLADQYNIKFFESSAKDNTSIDVIFQNMAQQILKTIDSEPSRMSKAGETLKTPNQNKKDKTGGCC